MKITTYQQAKAYLEGFIHPVEFRNKNHLSFDPLARMRHFLHLLGDPQNKFASVHVGGTAGKGSTAYLVSHILTTAGYKTGLTLSPHLEKMNERMQVGRISAQPVISNEVGDPQKISYPKGTSYTVAARNARTIMRLEQIRDEGFVQLVNEVMPVTEQMKESEHGQPSYFEILLAMAFLYFAKENVDIAVVEVGLGGRFDATNLIQPLLVVLTNVGLDHTEILGDTVEKIAREKVGIIKKLQKTNDKLQMNQQNTNLIVITGVTQPTVIAIVENHCKEVGVPLFRLGKDFSLIKRGDALLFDGEEQIKNLSLSLQGDYQIDNAALAIEAVVHLRKLGFPVPQEQIKQALQTASFAGRFEILYCHPEFPPRGLASRKRRISGSPTNYKGIEMLKPTRDYPLHGVAPQEHLLHSSGAVQHDKKINEKSVPIVLDGAHNVSKMQAFLTSLQNVFPTEKKIFIIAFKQDKNAAAMLSEIIPIADTLIVTQFHQATDVSKHAGMDVERLEEDIKRLGYYDTKKIVVGGNSSDALTKALTIQVSHYPNIPSIIVVTGSLYLVGEIRQELQQMQGMKKG